MRSTTLVTLAALALIAPPVHAALPLVLDALLPADLAAALGSSYDYIVVGGGNTGLALAARLASGNSSSSVLVLEAGSRQIGNPGIDIPGLAGYVLGGSSALNFLAYTRGHKLEYDSWSKLGVSGWSWNSLLPYFKKSEQFHAPTKNSEGEPVVFDAAAHGTSGPVNVAYPPYLSPQFVGFFDALTSLGLPLAPNHDGGANAGAWYSPSTMNPTTVRRETSEAYLRLNPSNLVVVVNAQVTQVTWASNKAGGNVVASGVSFVVTGTSGPSLSVSASREVILSAGSIQTPQLLELSGVGRPSIINPLGISTVVDLPGVGENLQDHPAVVTVYKLKPGVESLDNLSNDPIALTAALADYAMGQGILTQVIYPLAYLSAAQFLSSADRKTALSLMVPKLNPLMPLKQLAVQAAQYFAATPQVELLPINAYFGATAGDGKSSYISLASCLQHSFSRGTIHISSSDPLAAPAIDPKYLEAPVDAFLLNKAAQYTRRIATTGPLAAFIDSEVEPGPSVQTDAEWDAWVASVVRTEFHPVGTAAMLPRADNGVVDSKLLVYGTANVRVVDLSILPVHISTHPQSLAYAIAELAADLIL